jgi:hypothetical protein
MYTWWENETWKFLPTISTCGTMNTRLAIPDTRKHLFQVLLLGRCGEDAIVSLLQLTRISECTMKALADAALRRRVE